MIYLRQQDASILALRLIDMLKPGGWLIPGPSDPITTYLARLTPKETEDGLVFQKPTTINSNTSVTIVHNDISMTCQ